MSKPGDVPCGSCHKCCSVGQVALSTQLGDDIESYRQTTRTVEGDTFAFLDRKPNGECVYLEAGRCSIHDRRPFICREFDCRTWYLMHTREQRKRMCKNRPGAKEIMRAGRDRLKTLEPPYG